MRNDTIWNIGSDVSTTSQVSYHSTNIFGRILRKIKEMKWKIITFDGMAIAMELSRIQRTVGSQMVCNSERNTGLQLSEDSSHLRLSQE